MFTVIEENRRAVKSNMVGMNCRQLQMMEEKSPQANRFGDGRGKNNLPFLTPPHPALTPIRARVLGKLFFPRPLRMKFTYNGFPEGYAQRISEDSQLMASTTAIAVSPAEYLQLERQANVKHEYRDGEIVEMPGSSRQHNLLGTNLIGLLYQKLRDGDFEVYPSDMRVKVSEAGLYTYPDASVVAGEPEFEDAEVDTLLNPVVLFEILSPSTESYDRGEKFTNYQTIDSLQEYVLISQDRMSVDRYTRKNDHEWTFRTSNGPEASVELASLGCELKLGELYHKVPLRNPT